MPQTERYAMPPASLPRPRPQLLWLISWWQVLFTGAQILVLACLPSSYSPANRQRMALHMVSGTASVLVAGDSEGVVVGMDMTFSGLPIGRVRRVELAPDGKARILIDVPRKDPPQWLRQSSVFTPVRGLVCATIIRAYSGILTDPPRLAWLGLQLQRAQAQGRAAQAELTRQRLALLAGSA